MAETELKVTQTLEKLFTIAIFFFIFSWCLVPFNSNIYWDCKHKTVSTLVATGREWRQEQDTQQENSNKKLAAHKYNSCNSDA
jgi:hypothetical protein